MDAIDYPTSTKDPNKSLRLSLELSIKHMKNTVPDALNLFGFIGLLPGGVNEKELTQMWESNKWMPNKDALVRASLLVYKTDNKGQFIYSMLPFMSIRAYELLEENEERRHCFHMKCCKLFKEYCYSFYISERPLMYLDSLTEHESNIWACIYRSLNRKKNIEYDNDDVKSSYSDYFISDQEKSLERLSVSRFNANKYKEKEEINTMEKLIEVEKESSDSEGSEVSTNISKLLKKTNEVNRSNERNYKSHFQLSPKESEKNKNEEDKRSETQISHKYNKTKRRQRKKKVGNIDQQKKSKFFDEELLVLYYSVSLIIMDKTTDALKAVTEYSQKHGISELSKGNLLKTQAVLMVRGKRINVMSAVKLLKQAGA